MGNDNVFSIIFMSRPYDISDEEEYHYGRLVIIAGNAS
jgi:hypothetical protein